MTSADQTTRDSYIDTRRIGDAKITVINDGDVEVPLSLIFSPEAIVRLREDGEYTDTDLFWSSQLVIHIAIGDASIIIDPAFDDPGTPWDRRFATQWSRVRRTPGLAAGLAAIGVAPEAVTDVLITHAHDDHFVGALRDTGDCLQARFPNARHLIGRGDWTDNPRRERPDDEVAIRLGAIAALGQLIPVAEEYAVAPGVTLIPAPGETPGHSIVRVASGGETFYALGDLFHHPAEVVNLDWCAPWNDPAVQLASRRAFLATAPPDATIIFTHEPFPGWGRIAREGEAYRWERD